MPALLLKRSSGCIKKKIYFTTNSSRYIPIIALPASNTIMVEAHTFSTPAAGVAGFLMMMIMMMRSVAACVYHTFGLTFATEVG